VDSVLTAIVRRARQLLGTDVSYLTLNDPAAGDTYMRVTDGSVSARFQALRLPMGAGLGGLVAQTAAPRSSWSCCSPTRRPSSSSGRWSGRGSVVPTAPS